MPIRKIHENSYLIPKPDTRFGDAATFLPAGMGLICNYYREKYNINCSIVEHLDPESLQIFFDEINQHRGKPSEFRCAFIFNGKIHSTPVFYLKDNQNSEAILIADSLGSEGEASNINEIMLAIRKQFPDILIMIVDEARQAGHVGCRTDAFVFVRDVTAIENNAYTKTPGLLEKLESRKKHTEEEKVAHVLLPNELLKTAHRSEFVMHHQDKKNDLPVHTHKTQGPETIMKFRARYTAHYNKYLTKKSIKYKEIIIIQYYKMQLYNELMRTGNDKQAAEHLSNLFALSVKSNVIPFSNSAVLDYARTYITRYLNENLKKIAPTVADAIGTYDAMSNENKATLKKIILYLLPYSKESAILNFLKDKMSLSEAVDYFDCALASKNNPIIDLFFSLARDEIARTSNASMLISYAAYAKRWEYVAFLLINSSNQKHNIDDMLDAFNFSIEEKQWEIAEKILQLNLVASNDELNFSDALKVAIKEIQNGKDNSALWSTVKLIFSLKSHKKLLPDVASVILLLAAEKNNWDILNLILQCDIMINSGALTHSMMLAVNSGRFDIFLALSAADQSKSELSEILEQCYVIKKAYGTQGLSSEDINVIINLLDITTKKGEGRLINEISSKSNDTSLMRALIEYVPQPAPTSLVNHSSFFVSSIRVINPRYLILASLKLMANKNKNETFLKFSESVSKLAKKNEIVSAIEEFKDALTADLQLKSSLEKLLEFIKTNTKIKIDDVLACMPTSVLHASKK